jgi:Arc/MetJ-type ribon-helix-helix transcriptional regulator
MIDISDRIDYFLQMEVDLTPEQADFLRYAVQTGRVRDPAEAVRQALSLWMERERRRAEFLTSLDAAEASLARGEGRPITRESMKSLARDVMERNRHRFPVESQAGR